MQEALKRDLRLTGSGLFLPDDVVSNAELAQSFYAGAAPGARSDGQFIEKATGVRERRVIDKAGILDPDRLRPRLAMRPASALSLQAEMAVAAARQALAHADLDPARLGLVVLGSTALERAYPALAIEVQAALGAGGFAFDLSAACSSATFAMQLAVDALRGGSLDAALVISAEIPTAQVDFRDAQTRFIFGDGAAAVVLQAAAGAARAGFRVLGTQASTRYANTIRNDFGFLNRCQDGADEARGYFRQNGVRVLRDVVPMATEHLLEHLQRLRIAPQAVHRLWLHQANVHINRLIARRVLGPDADDTRAPSLLAVCGNLASAGSVAAFHRFHHDLPPGAVGIVCSFGAGYSVGSVVLQRMSAS